MLALNRRPFAFEDICGQKSIVQEMKKRSLTKDFPSVLIFGGESGTGKAQPLDSLVFTPSGFRKMGEIQLGDFVAGLDGKFVKVLGVFPQGSKDIYQFEWSDGTFTESCKDHLWLLQSSLTRTGQKKGTCIFTTQDIVEAAGRAGNKTALFGSMYSVPIAGCVDFPRQDVEIPPYLLGSLIAGGCLLDATPRLSVYEDDVRLRVESDISTLDMHLRKVTEDKDNRDYRLVQNSRHGNLPNPIVAFIKERGLNEKSNLKHIPREYLFNDRQTRILLLRGLYDGDGYTSNSTMSYTTTSEQLKDDVCFLVRSLGGVAKSTFKIPYFPYKGERRPGQKAYTIYIQLPEDRLPFSSLKHTKNFSKPQRKPWKAIRKVSYVGKKDCQCIYVESPYHCYITNGFTVTHNTTVAQIIAAILNDENPLKGDRCLNPNPESPESKAILNETFNMSCSMYDASRMAKEDVLRLEETISSASMFGGKRILIVDEAQELSKTSKGITLKLLEKKRQDAYIILCTMNPDAFDKSVRSRGLYYQFRSPSSYDIAEYLFKLTEEFGKDKDIPDSFYQEGLITIAENCEGSVRMAVQNLERCLVGELFTIETIHEAFGFASNTKLLGWVTQILNRNTDIFKEVRTMDLKDFFYSSYKFISDCLIYLRTKTVDAPWKVDQYVKLENQTSKIVELFNLYADIDLKMGAYFKPTYCLARLSDFFVGSQIPQTEITVHVPVASQIPAVSTGGHKVR
jgi:DNA polymerase III delta prime subunit